jgi:hypothetical protein
VNRRRARQGFAVMALLAAGCSIAEVATTEPDDLLVVEGVLRPNQSVQRILLHSSLTAAGSGSGPAYDADVQVTGPRGVRIRFEPSPESDACLDVIPEARFACYVTRADQSSWILPGEEYNLEVVTSDGGRAYGRTRIPGRFDVAVPSLDRLRACSLPPATALPLTWSRSAGTWSYIAEMEIHGLRAALAELVPGEIPDPLSLTGLAISEADTTMTLPGDFGIFERAQFDQALLIAIRDGLPAGVSVHVTIAAADRNYVNGVRGGSFNPSGRVRVPSVAGAATGLFGSMFVVRFRVEVEEESLLPPCLGR